MDIKEQLQKLIQIKEDIKQAIAKKGIEIYDTTLFSAYPELIKDIQGGGGTITDKVTSPDVFVDTPTGVITDNLLSEILIINQGQVTETSEGICSDFSNDNFLMCINPSVIIPESYNNNKTFKLSITTANDVSTSQVIISSTNLRNHFTVGITNNTFFLQNWTSSYQPLANSVVYTSGIHVDVNTSYDMVLTYNNSTVTLTVNKTGTETTDSISFGITNTNQIDLILGKKLTYNYYNGNRYVDAFKGSIDKNSIKLI